MQYPDRNAMGQLVFFDLEVTILSDVNAIAFGRWQIRRGDSRLDGLFTLHLRSVHGDWIILSDHTSTG